MNAGATGSLWTAGGACTPVFSFDVGAADDAVSAGSATFTYD